MAREAAELRSTASGNREPFVLAQGGRRLARRSVDLSGWRWAVLLGIAVALVTAASAPVWAQEEEGAASGTVGTPAPQVSEAGIVPPLSVVWTFSMGPEPGSLLTPVVKDDLVFISHDGKLRCLELQTGAQKWEFEVEEGGVCTAPVLFGDLVIVGANTSDLYGLNAADGEEVWKTKCGGAVAPTPLVFGESLILAAEDTVYALDPASGEPTWVSSLVSGAAWGPVTDGAGIYFLCQDGSVQGVDPATGRFRWRSQVLHGPRAFPPIVAGGRTVVARAGRLMAIARTGAVSWTAEMPAGIGAPPTAVDDTLYVPCVDGLVRALHARSGRDQHRQPIKLESPATAPPLVSGGVIMVGTAGALLHAANLESGELEWLYRCRAPEQPLGEAARFGIYAPLVEASGFLLCLTGGGDLFCFSSSAADPIAPRFSDLKPEPASALPGKEAVTVSFVVVDDGSGVEPRSVALTMDGDPIKIAFDPSDGAGEITFPLLPDGSHVVKVTAKDFRGNEGSVEWSFLTDKTIAPEEQPSGAGTTRGRLGTRTTTRPGATVR